MKHLHEPHHSLGMINQEKEKIEGFTGGSMVKNPPAKAGDIALILSPESDSSPHLPQLKKSLFSNNNPAQPKINKIIKKKQTLRFRELSSTSPVQIANK